MPPPRTSLLLTCPNRRPGFPTRNQLQTVELSAISEITPCRCKRALSSEPFEKPRVGKGSPSHIEPKVFSNENSHTCARHRHSHHGDRLCFRSKQQQSD